MPPADHLSYGAGGAGPRRPSGSTSDSSSPACFRVRSPQEVDSVVRPSPQHAGRALASKCPDDLDGGNRAWATPRGHRQPPRRRGRGRLPTGASPGGGCWRRRRGACPSSEAKHDEWPGRPLRAQPAPDRRHGTTRLSGGGRSSSDHVRLRDLPARPAGLLPARSRSSRRHRSHGSAGPPEQFPTAKGISEWSQFVIQGPARRSCDDLMPDVDLRHPGDGRLNMRRRAPTSTTTDHAGKLRAMAQDHHDVPTCPTAHRWGRRPRILAVVRFRRVTVTSAGYRGSGCGSWVRLGPVACQRYRPLHGGERRCAWQQVAGLLVPRSGGRMPGSSDSGSGAVGGRDRQ